MENENVKNDSTFLGLGSEKRKLLFMMGLDLLSTSKTRKYFLDLKTTDSLADEFIETVRVLSSFHNAGSQIVINNEGFNAGEYEVPKSFADVIAAAHVYANDESIGINEEYYDYARYVTPDDGIECMSPLKMKQFFKRFNENQYNDGMIITVPVRYDNPTIFDFKYGMMNDHEYSLLNPAGKYDEFISLFLGIPSLFIEHSEQVESHSIPNDEEVAKWLVGELKGHSIHQENTNSLK